MADRNMERIKVLLVDDDHLILNDLQRLINWQALGFEIVAVAYNGKSGIERCETCKPQIIFTDMKMPIMNGIEMMRAIRKTNEKVVFVVLSAYSEFEYAKQALDLGAFSYVLKEKINQNSLLEIVKSLKEVILQQAKTAYMSILNVVQAYIKESYLEPEESFNDLRKFFNLYYDSGAGEWSLQNLSGDLCKILETKFRDNGIPGLIDPKEFETKEELSRWVFEQIFMIQRLHTYERKQISPLISKTMLFIENNYPFQDLCIRKIADFLQMSESRISVCFKKETGFTINEYIKKVRIGKAKELLAGGEHKVYEVAHLVGFHSSQYFSKVFYQETKQIPQHFRRLT